MVGWVFGAAAVLVAAAGLAYRRRISALRGDRLSDDQIRDIETHGRIRADEPLDLEEAAEEEERFWGETWDEPEPL